MVSFCLYLEIQTRALGVLLMLLRSCLQIFWKTPSSNFSIFIFFLFMASETCTFNTNNSSTAYAPTYVWNSLLAPSCQGSGVCIRRIPGRMKMVLFNMQQNKGSGVGTTSTAFCHEIVTSIVTNNTQIILMSKAYCKCTCPHSYPMGIPRAVAASLWKALGFIP